MPSNEVSNETLGRETPRVPKPVAARVFLSNLREPVAFSNTNADALVQWTGLTADRARLRKREQGFTPQRAGAAFEVIDSLRRSRARFAWRWLRRSGGR